MKNPNGSQGYTWNPITGCLNHTPEGLCLGGGFPCYAYKLAHGRLKRRYLANTNIANPILTEGRKYPIGYTPYKDPFYPRFWEYRLDDIRNLKPEPQRGIFVCDMGELFGDWIPKRWQELIFNGIKLNPQHRFYLLTKQPQNLISHSPFPENCWVGVTATNDSMLRIACINLAQVVAKVKYISFEPLLEWSDYFSSPGLKRANSLGRWMKSAGIKWVIIGAQTKLYKPPKIEWVEEIVRACDKAGIPVFSKDNLWPLIPPVNGILGGFKSDAKGINFYLRQDMPK